MASNSTQYKGFLPLNLRMGLRYLFDPANRNITEKDLSQSDLKALGKLIYEANENNPGTIQYDNYYNSGLNNDVWYEPNPIGQSFSNPLFRVGTTIGRATYIPTLHGYVVKDQYDFPNIDLEEKNTWFPWFRNLHDKFENANKQPMGVKINIPREYIPKERTNIYGF